MGLFAGRRRHASVRGGPDEDHPIPILAVTWETQACRLTIDARRRGFSFYTAVSFH